MAEDILETHISQIIEEMCAKSNNFKIFYETEIPKLKGRSLSWKYDPNLSAEGYANRSFRNGSVKYEILLKRHPAELVKDGNFFLIAHEIEHHVQDAENYPAIMLHSEILSKFGSYKVQEKISGLLKSMMYDFSVNVKLKKYGIEIPHICLDPPIKTKSPEFNLTYIFRYVIFRRNSILLNEGDEDWMQACLKKYNDSYLVEIGNKIIDTINSSKLTDVNGDVNLIKIKFVIEEIFDNLKEFFPLSYKFKLTVTQTGQVILIVPTEIF
jgi:hypothetical protein